MIDYKLYQNKNATSPCFKKFYARSAANETYDMTKLAKHMSNHNTPYSAGAIKGILTDMVSCIKELLLDGKNVKIDDLAIFSVGLKSVGSDKLEDFTVTHNIKGMRLNTRATGNLSINKLQLESQIREHPQYTKPATTTPTTPTDPTKA
jgi:predicted histone-like DNA-binding protein